MSAAAAGSPIVRPCHVPSRRKACAGSTSSASWRGRLAKLTSKQARTARSPVFSSSSRRRSSESRLARLRTVQPPRAASRAPAILMASGSPAHAVSTSSVASGSASARARPMMLANRSRASAESSTSRSMNRLPARSGMRFRVVTSTAQEPEPGSNGLTCAASRASSRTMSTLRSVSRDRYWAARSSSPAGMRPGSTPRSRRKRARMSPGGTGGALGRTRLAYSCPSG